MIQGLGEAVDCVLGGPAEVEDMATGNATRRSTAAGDRPRVLMIAEHCNPGWVSVPLVGWSHFKALSALADIHLVTRTYNEENLLKAGLPRDRFTTLSSDAVERPLERLRAAIQGAYEEGKSWTTKTAVGVVSYYYFEHLLWRQFGARIRAGEFDLVHRLTPLNAVSPSLVAKRCARAGVPFVIGPLNGGLPWPKGFDEIRSKERELIASLRGLHRLMPGYRSTRRHAAAILVGSRAMRAQIPHWAADKVVYLPENSIEPALFGRQAKRPAAPPLQVVFVGRLVPVKGVDMLIEAAAPLVREGRVALDIVGDGPSMSDLRALAARQGVGKRVNFTGWIAHAQLQDFLAERHVLGFPSVREFGGAVVLEAMSLGLVPVVADYGGPGELVSPGTGFAIPIGPRAQLVAGFREVLSALAADPSTVGRMGPRARERVQRLFTWDAKAAQVREVYRWVLGQRDRPDFGMPLRDLPEGGVAVADERPA